MKPPVKVVEPAPVVTITSRAPAGPAGVVKLIWVALVLTMLVAATPLTVTPVVPVRFVPVTTTTVPPAVGPLLGVRVVTPGPGAAVTVTLTVAGAEVPPALVAV